jgi:hypothetical protein
MQVDQTAAMQSRLSLRYQLSINMMPGGAKTGAGTARKPRLRIETPTPWQGKHSQIAGIFGARPEYAEVTAGMLARPEGFEPPTHWFVGGPSITSKIMIYMVFISPEFWIFMADPGT